jgi:serine/threonine-protein kinase SRPK3
VIPSRPLHRFYFVEADSRRADEFDVALGDWGVSSWKDKHLTESIQPIALRSPEVLLKASWDETTDWWNLGAVVLELFRAIRMFSGQVPPDGHYEVRQHLAEIVDLFGPFPKKLLERGDKQIERDMFDDDGQVKGAAALNRPGLATETWLPGVDQEGRELFTSFLKAMMKIEPSERADAIGLLRHPWLGAMQ